MAQSVYKTQSPVKNPIYEAMELHFLLAVAKQAQRDLPCKRPSRFRRPQNGWRAGGLQARRSMCLGVKGALLASPKHGVNPAHTVGQYTRNVWFSFREGLFKGPPLCWKKPP